MATITVSLPKEFEKAKEELPEVNWNEVIKQGILKRLDELKKFETLKTSGVLGPQKFEEFLRELKKRGAL